MKFPFGPEYGLITIDTEINGPSGSIIARLALDTGATQTLLNAGVLSSIGLDAALSLRRMEVTTGSSLEYSPVVDVPRIVCLGLIRQSFPVLCHTLPPSAGVDGLIGLDFLRGCKLSIDFVDSTIEIQTLTI
mgnify:CR=1 FL=1